MKTSSAYEKLFLKLNIASLCLGAFNWDMMKRSTDLILPEVKLLYSSELVTLVRRKLSIPFELVSLVRRKVTIFFELVSLVRRNLLFIFELVPLVRKKLPFSLELILIGRFNTLRICINNKILASN